jgi:hypothetical protein
MRSFIGNFVLAAALGVASVISVQAAPQAVHWNLQAAAYVLSYSILPSLL